MLGGHLSAPVVSYDKSRDAGECGGVPCIFLMLPLACLKRDPARTRAGSCRQPRSGRVRLRWPSPVFDLTRMICTRIISFVGGVASRPTIYHRTYPSEQKLQQLDEFLQIDVRPPRYYRRVLHSNLVVPNWEGPRALSSTGIS